MQISLKSLEGMAQKYDNARKQVARVREQAQETVMTVVRSAEVSGAAFSFGIVNGRWGSPEFLGMPVDFGSAMALHTLGFVLDKDLAPHLHNLADGALASYLTTLGFGVGKKMAAENVGLAPA